jgi:hypothetical protein
MRRLRFPLLALSLLLLAFSVHTLLYSDTRGHSLLTYLREHPETPEEAAARRATERANTRQYAARLRADAYERIKAADYENALTRLDQAAKDDPEGDQADAVREVRDTIAHAYVFAERSQ